MKKILTMLAALIAMSIATTASAQEPRAYKEGPVSQLSYIKVKNGKFDDYMKFLDTDYKALMEGYKKAGLIKSFSVYSTQARSPSEPDLVLQVTYENMAALDRTPEFDAVSNKVLGTDASQNKASIDRDAMRTVLGGEVIRELILK